MGRELEGTKIAPPSNQCACARGAHRGDYSATEQKTQGRCNVEEIFTSLKGRPGRRPGRNPQGRKAGERFIQFLLKARDPINKVFSCALKNRSKVNVLYNDAALLWTPVLGFLLRRTSRNKMDADRNDVSYASNLLRLANQVRWISGEQPTVPCSQTVCNSLKVVRLKELRRLNGNLFKYLVRSKILTPALLCGHYVVAIDATKMEERRGSGLKGHRRNRMVLHVRLLTPWGWALVIEQEPIHPWESLAEKQDCELVAFERLMPRLKKLFGRLGIILVGDALYGCAPMIEKCRRNNWHYLFGFKEGRAPVVYREAQQDLQRFPTRKEKLRDVVRGEGIGEVGSIQWLCHAQFNNYTTNIIEINQSLESVHSGTYHGEFITDLEINTVERAVEIAKWGRRRWLIENSFKTEKRPNEEGFGLEHTFCKNSHASLAMHMLMVFAHNLWQIFESGVLEKLSKGCRKISQCIWARKLSEALHYYDYSGIASKTFYLNHSYRAYLLLE